ncbi:MAG TPA: hypothetical protein VFA60_05245 [Terriglobales bacterium]|nr:hypothetical protein [Terriglobales bacterium]
MPRSRRKSIPAILLLCAALALIVPSMGCDAVIAFSSVNGCLTFVAASGNCTIFHVTDGSTLFLVGGAIPPPNASVRLTGTFVPTMTVVTSCTVLSRGFQVNSFTVLAPTCGF